VTNSEVGAFNAGVAAVLDLARQTAAAFRDHPSWKPTRSEFAAAALEELAEVGKELMIETQAEPNGDPRP
jgi:hypothetical protein